MKENYGSTNYWENRYAKEANGTFEWFYSWSEIKKYVEENAVVGLYKRRRYVDEATAMLIK